MDSRDSLLEYWAQPSPRGGEPELLAQRIERSQALLRLVSGLPKDKTILEIGCNMGRNLAYLFDSGYRKLSGIEINQHAVAMLRNYYPQLSDIEVRVGPAEVLLDRFADKSFDLVFTMAVLEHIHPDSAKVFDHIARVARQILAIEPMGRLSHRQFPHDIPTLFTRRGFSLRYEKPMSSLSETRDDQSMRHYYAFWFDSF